MSFPCVCEMEVITIDRFKIEKENGKMYAVALKNFTNKATGKEIKKGDKSGFFNSFETLLQDGTSWIDESSMVLNSRLTKSSFVCEKSVVSHCTVENTVVSNSNIKFVKIKNTNPSSSIIDNSTIAWLTHNDSIIKVINSEIKGTGIITRGKVLLNKCKINTTQIRIQSSSLLGVEMRGTDINITYCNINNADIGSRVTLYNSNILIRDRDSRVCFETKTKSKLFISNGYAVKACQIRQLHSGTKNITVYKHLGGVWCTTHPTKKKDNLCFFTEFIPDDVFAKNKLKINGNLFLWSKVDDMGNIFDFVNDEKELLKDIFPLLKTISKEDEASLNDTLFLDVLSVVLESVDCQKERKEFEQSVVFDIKKQIVVLNSTYLIFSNLLIDRVARIIKMNETYCRNTIESAYAGSKEIKLLYLPF